MTTITAALLLLGAAFAGLGTFCFLACATTDPDAETLRLTHLSARYGRRAAAAGLALWMLAWPTTPAPYTLLLILAATTAVASYITRGAPELIRRCAT